MRKLIAAINMTLDGFCDHTAVIADDEMVQHYNELLSNADSIIPKLLKTKTFSSGSIMLCYEPVKEWLLT